MQDWREEFGDQRLVEMLRQQPPQEGSSCRPSLQGMRLAGRGGRGHCRNWRGCDKAPLSGTGPQEITFSFALVLLQ